MCTFDLRTAKLSGCADKGQAKAQLSSFQEQLETFAQKYRKEIMNNAQFRENFNRMCQKCGVDPLQCACSGISV